MSPVALTSEDIARILNGSSAKNWIKLASHGIEVDACQKKIIASARDYDAYEFAAVVRVKDIAPLQERVLQGTSPIALRMFAQDIPGADIEALQMRLMEVGDAIDNYYFAANVPKADVQALYLQSRAKDFSSLHLQLVDDFKARSLQESSQSHPVTAAFRLAEQSLTALEDLRWAAANFKRTDVAGCQARLIDSGHAWSVSFFAAEAPGADVAACQEMVIAHGNVQCLYHFARHVQKADVQALFDKAASMDMDKHMFDRFTSLMEEQGRDRETDSQETESKLESPSP